MKTISLWIEYSATCNISAFKTEIKNRPGILDYSYKTVYIANRYGLALDCKEITTLLRVCNIPSTTPVSCETTWSDALEHIHPSHRVHVHLHKDLLPSLSQCRARNVSFGVAYARDTRLEEWQRRLRQLGSLSKDWGCHISIEEQNDSTRDSSSTIQDHLADLYETAQRELPSLGLLQYDTYSFGQPSTHFVDLWHGSDYIGLGPGTTSVCSTGRDATISTKVKRSNEADMALTW
jgi:hypothetical protein